MAKCEKCLLDENIPSVRISANGLCNYCNAPKTVRQDYYEESDEFPAFLEKYRHKRYQVIMAYSGGKDSSYTLKHIREKYNASVLAVTFNNGFLSNDCMKNINAVTDNLGVDSIIVKYPEKKLIKAFKAIEDGSALPRKSLEKASSICNLCIMFVKNMIYYEAIIRDIPIICFGWTPGQVEITKPLLKLDYRMIAKVFNNIKSAVVNELGEDYGRYFLSEEFMKENQERMPYLYYPFVRNEYVEKNIYDEIKQVGWEPPRNTDGNSSNCLLNSYANQRHLERYGFHPYAFEISSIVRNGCITREEGIGKLENIKNDSTFEMVKERFQKV